MWNQAIALNEYQQLMLRLNHRSPYNAVHSVAIDLNHVTVASLQSALNAAINQLGLGEPHFSADFKSVTYTPMKDPIDIISCDIALDKHIENEMNARFSQEAFPLRFFIISDNICKFVFKFCISLLKYK